MRKYVIFGSDEISRMIREIVNGPYSKYDGKVASCFLPFTTKYFNEYFQKNLPEDGAIDLYDENLTLADLKR